MTDLLVVLTCPRQGKSYLPDTIRSLERAGADSVDNRIVIADSNDPFLFEAWKHQSWDLRFTGRQLGNLRAFLEVFKLGVQSGVDRVLFFEDDIVACKNAIPRMQQVGVPDDCALTSFFDMKEQPHGAPNGLHRIPAMGVDGRSMWGTQAVMFPRRTMEYLVETRKFWVDDVPNKHCADSLFSHQLLYSPWPQYALHVPNLVQHVGGVSAIWAFVPPEDRVATSFPGEGFDALTL